MPNPLLEIKGLNIAFDTNRGPIQPVRDSSLSIFPGQTVAVVGESGCGKSVTALSILRLIPQPPGRVLGGQVLLEGADLLRLSEPEMRKVRGGQIAMIFQEPMTSLNPVYTIGDQIVEAITLHQHVGTRRAYEIAEKSLHDVGIADPRRRLHEYPHQMSGGMRQRVMIAMALSCRPKLLIADEPTTALDVTIQAQILELLRKLQRETGMAIMLITHDLGVVAENADVVAVMYASRIVEFATVEDLFDRPQHPYTEGLFKSIPRLNDTRTRLDTIPGMVPNPMHFPTGCKFHTRCHRTRALAASQAGAQLPPSPLNYQGGGTAGPPAMPPVVEIVAEGEKVNVMGVCVAAEPALLEVQPTHWGSCHFIDGFAKAPHTPPVSAHKRQVIATALDGGAQQPLPVLPISGGEVSR
jgi:oligopeptide/dipeptide ABC transporter ATP-binding protein